MSEYKAAERRRGGSGLMINRSISRSLEQKERRRYVILMGEGAPYQKNKPTEKMRITPKNISNIALK